MATDRSVFISLLIVAFVIMSCGDDERISCGASACPSGWSCDEASNSCVEDSPGAESSIVAETGLYNGIAASSDGVLYASTYTPTYKALVMATITTEGSMTTSFVDGAGADAAPVSFQAADVGLASSLAVDGEGSIHVAYRDDSTHTIKYAHGAPGSWTIETIPPSATSERGGVSLALDDHELPGLCYYDSTKKALRFASLADGAWKSELVIDPNGPSTCLVSGTCQGVDYGMSCSLGFLGSTPLIAFRDDGATALGLAVRKAGVWRITIIDGASGDAEDIGDVGVTPSLAISKAGIIGIAYYDKGHRSLKYFFDDDGVTGVGTVDDGITADGGIHDVGQAPSLVFLPGGIASIVYVDGSAPGLRHALQDGTGAWSLAPLDAPPGTCLWPRHTIAGDVVHVVAGRLQVIEGHPMVSLVHLLIDGVP